MTKIKFFADMNSKQRKILEAIFSNPVPKNLLWKDIESLLSSLGCTVIEGDGSRISFRFTVSYKNEEENFQQDFHRPHPGKEAKPYQVRAARNFLTKIGFLP